jgi:hypothetical protein
MQISPSVLHSNLNSFKFVQSKLEMKEIYSSMLLMLSCLNLFTMCCSDTE